MRILILGGTKFVGRHITRAARERGHTVTLFNRGQTNPQLFPSAEKLHGDRTVSLEALTGRTWDAVIDINGYLPRVVKLSAEQLKAQVGHYTFISTISVHKDFNAGDDEDAPLAVLDDPTTEDMTGDTYGGLKVLCEQVVQQTYGDSALIIRPAVVVGTDDHTDRFTYWVVTTANGGTENGEMLAPGNPQTPIQYIDGRDLAAFTIALTEQKASGIYEAINPNGGMPLGEILNSVKRVSGATTTFTWVDETFLLEQGIQPWTDLPLWTPTTMEGIHRRNNQRAVAAGLPNAPIDDTVKRILDWWNEERKGTPLRGALTPERAREILAAWKVRAGQ